MPDDLRDALTDIHGIGDAKADQILDVVHDHDVGLESNRLAAARDAIDDALDYHEADRHEYAWKFARRAHDILYED